MDRYKQLLLKQRDIMIALTARLNERDETIIGLQEELDAMDRQYKDNEEYAERKTRRIHRLEKAITDHQVPMPVGDEDEEDDQAQYFDSPQLISNQATNQDMQRRYPSEDDP